MKSIFNKANSPYLVSGALATATLLASGVFAVAPYIGFLSPVAALNVGLPLIVVGAVFSVVSIVLSCAAISKNNTIAEKNKVIVQKTQDIEKVISEQTSQLNQKNTEISRLKEQLMAGKKDNSVKGNVRRKAIIDDSRNGAKNAYSTPVEYVKGALHSVGSGLKSIMPSTSSVRNWIPSSKTVGYIAGGVGATGVIAYTATNVGFNVAINSSDTVSNSTNSARNNTLSSNLPLTFSNLNHQQIMQSKIDEADKKLANAKKWYNYQCVITEKGNISYKDDEPQWHKNLYKSESLEEIIDGGNLDNLFCQVDNSISMPKQQSTIIDSAEDIQAAFGKALTSIKEAFISGRVTRIVKDRLKDICVPISSWIFSPETVRHDDRSITMENNLNTDLTKVSSKIVDTAVAIYSNANTSSTFPANYEISLVKHNSTDTCSSQGVCSSDHQFKSGKVISEFNSSNIDASKQSTFVTFAESERLIRKVHHSV